MINKEQHIGKIYSSKQYGSFIITDYEGCERVTIKFLNTQYETVSSLNSIRIGNVRDKSAPSVFGGVVGDEVIKIGGKYIKEYYLWRSMLRRCYDEKYTNKNSTYKGCTVAEGWRYLSNFKEWCNNQIGFGNDGWQLDKDILVKGNKIYSEDTCCFVPREVNNLFIKRYTNRGAYPIGVSYHKSSRKFASAISTDGLQRSLGLFNNQEEAFLVYKEAKELHIKKVADKWKDQIDPRVYEALMNYQVEITD